MKVLILGGSGNISASVAKLAAGQGWDVSVFTRGNNKSLEKYGVKYIIGNLDSVEDTKKALKGCEFDVVADFIAFTKDQAERDYALFSGRVGQYIFISSGTVYQKPVVNHVISEHTPLKNNVDSYAHNKIACENYLMERFRDDDFPVTIVRPSHTYGETKLVLPFTKWEEMHWTWADRILNGKEIVLHAEGKTTWVVTHSDDFAKGFVGIMGNPAAIGHAFHITTDEVRSWNYYMEVLGDALGKKPNIVYLPTPYIEERIGHPGFLYGDKSESTCFDNSKIKSFVPGFYASIPYHVGIRRSVEYYSNKPDARQIDPEYNRTLDKMIEDYRAGAGR